MPGASHGVFNHQSLCERPVIVRTVSAHCKDLHSTPHQQRVFFIDYTEELSTIGDAGERNSGLQVGLNSIVHIAHLIATRVIFHPFRNAHSASPCVNVHSDLGSVMRCRGKDLMSSPKQDHNWLRFDALSNEEARENFLFSTSDNLFADVCNFRLMQTSPLRHFGSTDPNLCNEEM